MRTRKQLKEQAELREQAQAEAIHQSDRLQTLRKDRMSLLRNLESPLIMKWD